MLSTFDKIKLMVKKFFGKQIKITNSDQLQELIDRENLKLNDLKATSNELKAEHNVHKKDLDKLNDSKNKLMKKAKSYKQRMDAATANGDDKEAAKMFEGVKEGKRLVDETNIKIKAEEHCTDVFSRYSESAKRAVDLQQRKVDDLNVKLSELKIKEQISKSFSKFSNLDLDITEDAAIQQLAHDIEIDYNKVETQLNDLEHRLGVKDDIESYINKDEEYLTDDSLEDFMNKLDEDEEEKEKGEKLW